MELITAGFILWARSACVRIEDTAFDHEYCTAERDSQRNVTVAGIVGLINLLCVVYTVTKGLEENSSMDCPEMERSFTV